MTILGKEMIIIRKYPYRVEGERFIQIDKLLSVVTKDNNDRFEFKTIKRLSSENTAPFDNGGSSGGGINKSYVDTLAAKDEFKWL